MMRSRSGTLLAASMLLFLSGCAAKGEFPSLSQRPFERGETTAPAVSVVPLPQSDPAFLGRISQLTRDAEASSPAFETALSGARRAVGNGHALGSEAWIEAQMQVSSLERLRGPVQVALAQLDDEKRRLLLGGPSPDRTALDDAWARVQQLSENQRASIRNLIDRLNRR